MLSMPGGGRNGCSHGPVIEVDVSQPSYTWM